MTELMEPRSPEGISDSTTDVAPADAFILPADTILKQTAKKRVKLEFKNLVLRGHSTRTLAEKLRISTDTVKLHRKHAYAKLEVSSQAELFYLFLDSVMSAENYQGGDALVAYMQPPTS